MINKVIYLTYTRSNYSLNAVLIKGLRQNGVEVFDIHVKNRGIPGFFEALSFYRNNSNNADVVIIGYDSPALAIFMRFFTTKKLVYNAAISVYERFIISRELVREFSIKAIYYWMLDFIAVDFANLTIVETDEQKYFFEKLFNNSGKNIFKSYIGVDEDNFFYEPSVPKFSEFTVIFRGALMPEAGAEYVVEAAKILEKEDIKFIMLAGGMLVDKIKKQIEELGPKNLEFHTELFSYDDLRRKMQASHLSLGQLSDHPRLNRTIPHKAYESLAMKIPYLTASNRGIMELLKPGYTCITCEPADAKSLAEKIIWAKNNPSELERIALNGYELFRESLSIEKLGKSFKNRLDELFV